MKKLFIYALLLVTGFAFYSCDDRFDNPVTQQQDPSNPAATWTYEVKIEFDAVNFGYVDEEGFNPYENPDIVYVYNNNYQPLGTLTRDEQNDDDIFMGTLKGSIGDTLIISTLENFDFYSKQDGTWETITKNCVLQVAKLPIIVANSTTGKIGTQKVIMKNQTKIIDFSGEGCFLASSIKSVKISSESLSKYMIKTEDKSFTINFAEDVTLSQFPVALVNDAEDPYDAVYRFDIENDVYKASAYFDENVDDFVVIDWDDLSHVGWADLGFNYLNEGIDLTKYCEFKKAEYKEKNESEVPEYWSTNLTIYSKDPNVVISQSGKDAIPVSISMYDIDKITIKGINIKDRLYINKSTVLNGQGTDITLEGDNVIDAFNSYWGGLDPWGALVTFKGKGTLTVNGENNWGIDIYDTYKYVKEDGESEWKRSELIIEDGVKIISKHTVYVEYGCSLTLNGGTFEAAGAEGRPAIVNEYGKLTIGTGITSFKATAGEGYPYIIYDSSTGAEAALETLVEDPTQWNDVIENGVRTITKK